jgi:hypothetical protein
LVNILVSFARQPPWVSSEFPNKQLHLSLNWEV